MNSATKVLIEQVQLIEWHEAEARRLPEDRRMHRGIAYTLKTCEPLAVSPSVASLLSHAAASCPDWPLAESDLLIPNGLVSFQAPSFLDLSGPPRSTLQYFAWWTWKREAWDELTKTDPQRAPAPAEPDGVAVIFWDVRKGVTINTLWPFGETLEDRVRGRFPKNPETPHDAAMDRILFQTSQTFFRFIKQRLVGIQKESPERIAIAQAEKVGLQPRDVLLVTLRRLMKQQTDEALDVEWSHRWWVSAHWRQQPCGPGKTARRPVLILPYIKGPEDKPLLPKPQRVFDVKR